jgi:hypothetical protein
MSGRKGPPARRVRQTDYSVLAPNGDRYRELTDRAFESRRLTTRGARFNRHDEHRRRAFGTIRPCERQWVKSLQLIHSLVRSDGNRQRRPPGELPLRSALAVCDLGMLVRGRRMFLSFRGMLATLHVIVFAVLFGRRAMGLRSTFVVFGRSRVRHLHFDASVVGKSRTH